MSCAHSAGQLNWPETLKFLYENGANLDAQDTNGYTPLMYAVNNEATDSVRQLLRLGVKVHLVSNSGETALHKAIATGALDRAKLLLEFGADVEAVTKRCKADGLSRLNCLELAAYSGRIPVFEAVLQYVPDYKQSGEDNVLSAAVKGSELEMLKFLLRRNKDIFQNLLFQYNKDRNSLLHVAVSIARESVDREIVRQLHRAGIPIDSRIDNDSEDFTRTALAVSVQYGHIAMARSLLELGATPYCRGDPNKKSWTFLHEAVLQARLPRSGGIREHFDELLTECEPWITKNNLISSKDYFVLGSTSCGSKDLRDRHAACAALPSLT